MGLGEILSHLEKVKQTGDNQYIACCPAHDDKTPSLSISEVNGKVLLKCFAGCDYKKIIAAMGLDMKDFSKFTSNGGKWQFIREHIYTDEKGCSVAKKELLRKPNGEKTAVWYGFRNNAFVKGLNGLKPPLYHLPALISSTGEIYIAEGEKDVETLEKMGYTSTTLPNGAGAKWSKRFSPYFEGRDVIILADNDKPGKEAASNTAAGVINTAKSVKVIPSDDIMPGLKEKGDISDIVSEVGESRAKTLLEKAVAEAGYFVPIQEADDEQAAALPEYFITDGRTKQTKVSCPLLAKHVRENSRYIFERNEMNDSVNRFWYIDGFYKQVSDIYIKGMIKKHITDFCEPCLKMNDVNEVFNNLITDLNFVDAREINADENYINFENGLLYIDTMELRPHSPDKMSTVRIPCNWDKTATAAPVFDKFMNDLTEGDAEKRELLLQFIGAVISNIRGYRHMKLIARCEKKPRRAPETF